MEKSGRTAAVENHTVSGSSHPWSSALTLEETQQETGGAQRGVVLAETHADASSSPSENQSTAGIRQPIVGKCLESHLRHERARLDSHNQVRRERKPTNLSDRRHRADERVLLSDEFLQTDIRFSVLRSTD